MWKREEATQAVPIPPLMRELVRLSLASVQEHLEVDLRFLRALRERLPILPQIGTALTASEEEQECASPGGTFVPQARPL